MIDGEILDRLQDNKSNTLILDVETNKSFQNDIFKIIRAVVENNSIDDGIDNNIIKEEEKSELKELRLERSCCLLRIRKLVARVSVSEAQKIAKLIEPLIVLENYETPYEYKFTLEVVQHWQTH